MEPMYPTSRMQCRHGSSFLSTFEPRPTAAGPSCAGHEGVNVFGEIGQGGGGGTEGDNGFGLAFSDYGGYVVRYVFGNGENTAVADGSVWSKEHYTIIRI